MKVGFLIVILFVMAVPVFGAAFRGGNVISIPSDVTVTDDLSLFGGQVVSEGHVLGDLHAFAGSTTVQGPVENNADIASGNATITGPIGHSLRVFAGNVAVGSKVGWNLYAFCGNVTLTKGAVVGKDLVLMAGSALISGHVKGGVHGAVGEMVISGPIDGNVKIEGDSLRILPGAVIKGNVIFTGRNKPEISPQARVTGTVKHNLPPAARARRGHGVGGWLIKLLMLLVMGAALYAFSPRGTTNAAALVCSWPRSLLVGIIGLIAIPIGCVILMAIVIGLPVGIVSLIVYAFLLIAGVSVSGLALGRCILQRLKVAMPKAGWSLLLGLVILMLLFLIPILGGLIKLAAVVLGFGAILRAFGQGYRTRQAEAA